MGHCWGGVSRLCKTATGKSGTPGDPTVIDVNQPRGVCGGDDVQDTSNREAKGCWEHPGISGAVLEG